MNLKPYEITTEQQQSMASSEEFDVIESYEKRYTEPPHELIKKEADARKERILKTQAELENKYAEFEKKELERLDAEAARRLIEQEQARVL
jgi:hypothetical protein